MFKFPLLKMQHIMELQNDSNFFLKKKKRKILGNIGYNVETRKRSKRKRHFTVYDITLNILFLNLFTKTSFGLHTHRIHPREVISNIRMEQTDTSTPTKRQK